MKQTFPILSSIQEMVLKSISHLSASNEMEFVLVQFMFIANHFIVSICNRIVQIESKAFHSSEHLLFVLAFIVHT